MDEEEEVVTVSNKSVVLCGRKFGRNVVGVARLGFYVLFLIAWLVWLLLYSQAREVHVVEEAIEDLFVSPPFSPLGDTFFDITDQKALWDWLDRIAIEGIYNENYPEDQDILTPDEEMKSKDYFWFHNVNLGFFLKQERYRLSDCSEFGIDYKCMDESEPFNGDFESEPWTQRRNLSQYETSLTDELYVALTNAFQARVLVEGEEPLYSIHFSSHYDEVENNLILDILRENLWIDSHTARLTVTIPTYNIQYRVFVTVELVVTFSLAGSLEVEHGTLYAAPNDAGPRLSFTLFLSAVIILCIVMFTSSTLFFLLRAAFASYKIRGMWGFCSTFWSDFWTIYNLLVNSLMIVTLVLYFRLYVELETVDEEFGVVIGEIETVSEAEMFQVAALIEDAASKSHEFLSLLSVSTVLLFFASLQFVEFNASLGLLSTTLRRAGKSLISFLLLFLFLFLSFSFMGFIAFGTFVSDYNTIGNAIMSTSTFMFGQGAISYDDLARANNVLAPIYYWSFNLLAVLILTNVFIAILAEFYVVAKEMREKEARQLQKKRLARRQGRSQNESTPIAQPLSARSNTDEPSSSALTGVTLSNSTKRRSEFRDRDSKDTNMLEIEEVETPS